jgi:hypothetical protein
MRISFCQRYVPPDPAADLDTKVTRRYSSPAHHTDTPVVACAVLMRVYPDAMPQRRSSDVAYAVGIALGLAIVVVGFWDFRSSRIGYSDFSYVWAGGRALLDGLDPYSAADWRTVLDRYGTQFGPEQRYVFGPWVALAVMPLALLPLSIASGVWTFGGMALAALGLRHLLSMVAPRQPLLHALAGLSLFASQPGIASFWSGQFGFLHVAALAEAACGALRGGLSSMGALALVGKPHLFAFAWLGILRTHVARGRTRVAAAVGGALATIVVGSWLWLPSWGGPLGWLDRLRPDAERRPTTLAVGLEDLIGPGGPFVAAAIVLVSVVLALRVAPASDRALAVWLALSAVAATWGYSYDHLVLIVPIAMATAAIGRERPAQGVWAAALAFFLFLIVPALLTVAADVRRNDSYAALVPLAVLGYALFTALHRYDRER